MKKIIIITITFAMASLSCKAQIPTKNIYEDGHGLDDHFYYKDIDNDYNRFEGTWVFTDGNTTLTIKLQKKEMKHVYSSVSNYYADVLVGEYRYVENGIEIINTLPNLLNDFEYPYNYNIRGGTISRTGDPLCHNCGPNERKVYCSWNDPTWDFYTGSPKMIFRHYVENGVEKIHCSFVDSGSMLFDDPNDATFTGYSVPFGEYTLIKQ